MPIVPFNQEISLTTASAFTGNYQTNQPGSPKAFMFFKKSMNDLLSVSGAQGIRFYNGQNSAGVLCLIAVAIDSNGNDITTKLMDKTVICPPDCGNANTLNHLLP